MFKKFVQAAFVAIFFFPLIASAANCPNLARNLSFGSRGSDVVQLQQFLIAQNLLAVGNDTGYYGRLTQTAVQQFQCRAMNLCSGSPSANGYGVAGPRTRVAVFAHCSVGATTLPTPAVPTNTQPFGTSSMPDQTFYQIGSNPAECSPRQTLTLPCPSGQVGSITEVRTNYCTMNVPPLWINWVPISNTCTSTPGLNQSCMFNNQTVANGASVIAYNVPSADSGSTCLSQQRNCANGILSGTYGYATCSSVQYSSCTPFSQQTQILSCPMGQTGAITQIRTPVCPGPTWNPWQTTTNTCQAIINLASATPQVHEQVIYQPPAQHYAYAPAAIRLSDTLHVWACYNKDAGNFTDHILHVINGAANIVLSPTSGAWDSRHVCDPSITRGTFAYNGHQYTYALFYLGTDKDFGHNQIGVAFADSLNDPEQWVKYPQPLVLYPDDGTWGVGQPSATSINGGQVLLFYTKNGNTFVRQVDLANANTPNVGPERTLTTAGAAYLNGGQDLLRNLDLAYDPTRDIFFAVRDQLTSAATQSYPDYIVPNVNISWLPGTNIWGGGGMWGSLESITPEKTGYPRNHNAGIVRSEYGTLPDSQKVEVLYSTSCAAGDNTPCTKAEWTYHISSLTVSLTGASTPTLSQ